MEISMNLILYQNGGWRAKKVNTFNLILLYGAYPPYNHLGLNHWIFITRNFILEKTFKSLPRRARIDTWNVS